MLDSCLTRAARHARSRHRVSELRPLGAQKYLDQIGCEFDLTGFCRYQFRVAEDRRWELTLQRETASDGLQKRNARRRGQCRPDVWTAHKDNRRAAFVADIAK